MTYTRKTCMKPSIVKQLCTDYITFKTDAANFQSAKTGFRPVFTTH